VTRSWREGDGKEREAGQGHTRMRGVQTPQLHHDEEQAERSRTHRDAQVLPVRSAPHPPQGDPVIQPELTRTRSRPGSNRAEQLEELVARARLGDVEAFNSIVEETSVEVHGLALRLTGNEDDACDVVQEAYLRAFRSIARFRGEASVRTWLYRIVANCSASHHRKSKRRQETALVEPLVAAFSSSHELEAGSDGLILRVDERSRLIDALDRLSPALRAPVVLHDVYGFAHADISASLGISKSAAKVRLHRARRQLKDVLSEASTTKARGRKSVARVRRSRGAQGALAG
jgi:RNA polymerase sigma-70 factor (ECF subfamily)